MKSRKTDPGPFETVPTDRGIISQRLQRQFQYPIHNIFRLQPISSAVETNHHHIDISKKKSPKTHLPKEFYRKHKSDHKTDHRGGGESYLHLKFAVQANLHASINLMISSRARGSSASSKAAAFSKFSSAFFSIEMAMSTAT